MSAAFGAIAAMIWCNTPNHGREAQAQEAFRVVNPNAVPGPTVRLVPGDRSQETEPVPRPIGPAHIPDGVDELTSEERINVAVYETCNRSVVNIKTEVAAASLFLVDMVQEGAGSGSVLDKQGHVLTNFHVVENAREIQVTLFDGKDYEARVVGRDATTDVCVLKIDAPADSLFPVRFGDSTKLKVGQRVFAIGNPFSFERTMTTGIVSSLNRTLPSRDSHRSIKSIIQIDAAINPGNSGGPLLDSHGRLIGMNTAIASKTGQSTGVGFAIPSSHIARVVPELIANGRVIRPDHGIHKVAETERGILIVSLVPGGPAEQAGLRGVKITKQRKRQGVFVYETTNVDRNAADMIVAVDEQPTTKADDFLSAVDSHRPGDEITVTVIRQGRQVQVRMRLAAGE
ncbi:MAG: trypsin-like peptidase domain-containing protein [Pirellulales bacterium]|nr:trypsin-like peptidase domain-containing protein [Pirellulales bacterium]